MAELCVEEGYRAITVSKIARRAAVSRATFYEQFENREEVFLAVVDQSADDLLQRTEAACEGARSLGEPALEAGLGVILAWVADDPAAAWICFVEAFGATPASTRRYLDTITRFTDLLGGALPTEVPRPKTIEESLAGGVASLLSGMIRAGEAERAPQMLPEIATFLRGPFVAV